jgi:ATP-dependent helicase HepA
VLLADEVGLGKTIEAGLILHRLLITGKIGARAHLVPDPLVHQWFIELLRRFNAHLPHLRPRPLRPAIDAARRGDVAIRSSMNSSVLCSIAAASLPGDDPGARRAGRAAGWDLLVVDEAHHLPGRPEAASPEYRWSRRSPASRRACCCSPPPPSSSGWRVTSPACACSTRNRYPDFARYVQEHDRYEAVARKARHLEAGDERALQDLLDRHGPGRVMFRNTRAAMPGFPRHLHRVPLGRLGAGSRRRDPRGWLAGFLRRPSEEEGAGHLPDPRRRAAHSRGAAEA